MPKEMEEPGSQAKRLQQWLNQLLEKFKKTPYVIPVVIALAAGVFFLVTAFAGTNCLAPLLPPLALLGLLWYFDIKSAKKMLLIGLVACLVFAGVWIYVVTGIYEGVEPKVGVSKDGKTLTNGTVEPLKGTAQTTYNFNLTVRNASSSPVARDGVKVIVTPVSFPSKPVANYSMARVTDLKPINVSGAIFWVANYSYSTTISTPINQHYFLADINNTWELAADYSSGSADRLVGPISKDTPTVASALILFSLVQVYASTFPIFAIMVLMIWWTRRARRMREDQMKKWQEERGKEGAKEPGKGKAKTPSLQKAMGLEEETFVCSECGADVPADATVCPKCGEKFD